jgi:hypothetical protein
MKEKVLDLWIAQLSLEKVKEKLEEEKAKIKDIIVSMTDDELTLLMDSFHSRQKEDFDLEVPDCVVYAIHELADREDAERA